ncbi:MAG: AEC family transporter [Oscillospiraceae bacterium]|nr:AEC family transporter [Oscillospiraceae bacterium]
MSAALHQIAVIFIGIAAGFLCRRLGVLTEQGTGTLSNLVVKLILPLYLFSAILNTSVDVAAGGVLTALLYSALLFLFSGLVAWLFVILTRPKAGDRGVYLFELMCGNVTYIGIPVCTAVLGPSAAFYASLLNIPYNLICFSLGVYLLAGRLPWRKIFNPAFLAALAAAILYMLRVPVPPLLLDGCAFIGQATSPCAMLIIGSVLGGVPLGKLFNEWRALPYVALRLGAIAALVMLLLRFTQADPVLSGVLVLMAAMPAATNSTMLCTIYGGNRELSAKLIFLSTALSAVTIPLWAACF